VTEAFKMLHNDEMPLLLTLAWSDEDLGLDHKQLVLEEIRSDDLEVCCLLYTFLHAIFCVIIRKLTGSVLP